jgi:hypothetical protein
MPTVQAAALGYIPFEKFAQRRKGSRSSHAGEEPASMEIVMIMFGSVLCTMTALNFIELRRIRKKLDTKQP